MNQEKKDAIKGTDGFLNDMWNGFTNNGKFEILLKEMGEENLEKSWDIWYEEFMSKEADLNQSEEDLNEETRL